eukprot:3915147-Pyramimonas_sp.AAC.1
MALGSVLLSKHLEEPTLRKPKNRDFSNFPALASEASFACSDERCVRRELYEVPGGNLVDGLPPVPSEYERPTKRDQMYREMGNAIKASGLCTCPDRSCPTWHQQRTWHLSSVGPSGEGRRSRRSTRDYCYTS